MATLMGVVSKVVGEVFAVAADGSRRPLSQGDKVFVGEQLVTGAHGSVVLKIAGGGEVTLGRDSSLPMTAQLQSAAHHSQDGQQQQAVTQQPATPTKQDITDVKALQAAIAAGVDPTKAAEATAAGPSAGTAGGANGQPGGGHSFVLLTEVAGHVGPEIGFPTGPITWGPLFPQDRVAAPLDEASSSGPGAISIGENALGGPGGATQGGSLNYDFGSNGVGGFTWGTAGLPNLTSGGVPLTYTVSADGHTLTASANGTPVFTLTLTNINTGAFELTLLQPVDHPGAGQDTLTLNVPYTITDGTGGTSTSNLAVGIVDALPNAALSANGGVDGALLTHDAATLGVASDSNSADFSAAFQVNANYGADGAGSTVLSYSLHLAGADGSNSGLTSGGAAIFLHSIGGVIVASTSASVAGVSAANTIFSLSVNGSTGVVTLTQFSAIDHAQPGSDANFAGQHAVLDLGLVQLQGTLVVTDRDGDTATSSSTLDLGGRVSFADDGPSIAIGLGEGQVGALVTHDALTIGSASDSSTADFSGAFTITQQSTGADTPASVVSWTYAVHLDVNGGTASGLSSGGQAIYLYQIGNQVVGSTASTQAGVTAGNTVFGLSVDGSGKVTLTQYAELDHPKPGHDQQISLDTGLVSLQGTASITDFDGDKATSSASLDLGGKVAFSDDRPSIGVGVNGAQAGALETHDALTIGGASDSSTANFSGVFTITQQSSGADTPASAVSWSYSVHLDVPGGSASGLSSGGQAIFLYQVGNQVVGSTASTLAGVTPGNTVFGLSVDGSGKVTLTQYAELDHTQPGHDQQISLDTGLVSLQGTASITDFDGDKATSTASLDLGGKVTFHDDGPSIHVGPGNAEIGNLETHDHLTIGNASDSDTTDFSGAFAITQQSSGADTPASAVSWTYAVHLDVNGGTASGLTSGGQTIYLYQIGNQVVGSTASTQGAVTAGNTVFGLSVDGSGKVTLTQYAELDHPKSGNDQQISLGSDLVSLQGTASITDFDGDKATSTASLDLGGKVTFDDDGPSISVGLSNAQVGGLETHDHLTIGNASDSDTTDFSGAFAITQQSSGADTPASAVSWTYAVHLDVGAGTSSGLTSGGQAIYLYQIGNQVVGSTASTQGAVTAGNTVFGLSVDGSGKVTLTQYAELDHPKPGSDQQISLGSDLVSLQGTASITDFDGDKATSTASLDLGGKVTFNDDGPSITADLSGAQIADLETQDALTIGNASDHDTVDFSGAFTVTQQSSGADTPASAVSWTYAVHLDVAGGTASGLTSGGQTIYLYQIGNQVVGSTASTQGAVDTSNTVFGLSVDGSGKVTLTQYAELDHPKPGSDQQISLGSDLVSLQGTASITDFDGDKATSTASLDLGGKVTFNDDGPSISVGLGNAEIGNLETHDHLTIGNASDTATTDFSGAFVITQQNSGADTPASAVSWTYAVHLDVAGGTASGLSSGGQAIFLYQVGTQVVGSTSSTLAGVTPGNTVFGLSVDGSGKVTLTQYAAIDHTQPDHDQQISLGSDLVSLQGTASITDFDGDKATSTASLDLGGKVTFDDDTPSSNISLSDAQVGSLETHDALTIGDASDHDTVDFSGAFTITQEIAGADIPASAVSWTYAMHLDVAGGTASGLTSGGQTIYLYQIGTQVVGSTASTQAGVTAGNTVFGLSVDGSGKVTLTQYAELDHPKPGSDQQISLGSDLVSLQGTASITDFDGDKATSTASLDLGGKVTFDDDGPSISVGLSNAQIDALETHDALTIGSASDSDTVDFSGAFTVTQQNAGADTPASAVSWTYAVHLDVGAGTSSGLTSGGQAIYLYQIGNQVVGSTATTQGGVLAGNTVFGLSVDGSGKVTLTQYAELDHPKPGSDLQISLGSNLVSLQGTASITDFDGDKASATKSLDLGGKVTFDDDGPSISVGLSNAQIDALETHDALTIGANSDHDTVDFSGAFTVTQQNAGADTPASAVSWTYAVHLDVGAGTSSGLTSGGQAIYLYQIGNQVVGSTASTQAGVTAGNTVFGLSVDGSGKVTLTQYAELDHPKPGSDLQISLGSNLVSLQGTASITDFDGDKANATKSLDLGGKVTFDDDGPSISVGLSNAQIDALETHDALTIGSASDSDTVDFSGAFTVTQQNAGADTPASAVSWTYAVHLDVGAGTSSGLTSGGQAIYLYQIGNQVVGSTASTQGTVTAGNTVFGLSVDGSGKVTLTQYAELDHPKPGSDLQISLGSNLVSLQGTASITDFDGDKANATKSLDLGGKVTFDDDGPSISVGLSNAQIDALETHDALTIGANSDHDTVDFSGAFTVTQQNAGADTPASAVSWTYAVHLDVGAGTSSGLTSGGQTIYLYQIGNQVVGSTASTQAGVTAGNTVFGLSVDGSGKVTLTQYSELDHPKPGSDLQISLGSNLVSLQGTASITDFDGDKANATKSLDLGGKVTFDDDGPSISVGLSNAQIDALETHDALTIGANSDHDTADFSGAFTVTQQSAGADSPASAVSWTYALQLSAGVTQGSFSGLSSGGAAIYLYTIGGQVVGSTANSLGAVSAGNTVFSLSANSSTGVVTLTQNSAIDHALPGSDSNYDSQQAMLNTGLVQLHGTASITDFDGDTSTSSTNLDLGGKVTFADDGPSVNMLPPIQNVFDAKGFHLDGILDVNFGADGPGGFDLSGNTAPSGLHYVVTSLAGGGSLLTALDAGNKPFFTLQVNGDGSYSFDVVNSRPTAQVGYDLTKIVASGPAPSFTLTSSGLSATFTTTTGHLVNPSTNGMGIDNNTIDTGEQLNIAFSDTVYNASFKVQKLSTGDTLTWSVLSAAGALLATGTFVPPAGTGEGDTTTWNLLTNGHFVTGSAAQLVESGFSTVILGSSDGDYRVQTLSADRAVLPPDLALNFGVGVTDGDGDHANLNLGLEMNTPTLLVVGSNDSDSGTSTAQHTIPNPTDADKSGDIVGGNGSDVLVGDKGGTAQPLGNDHLVGGAGNDILFGDSINTDNLSWAGHAAGTHNGAGLQGLVDYLTATNGGTAPSTAQLLNYIAAHAPELSAVGDSIGGNDILEGGAGNDLMFGQGGNDKLIGGPGDDIMYGGTGADEFIWKAGDTGHDVIKDFNIAEGDTLNLTDLLQGEAATASSLAHYLNFSVTSGTTSIGVMPTGTGPVTQTIDLANVDLSAKYAGHAGNGVLSSGDTQAVLNGLLGDHVIKTDTV
ncbi:retention module-containing protein [Pseudomonas sp. LA21]|uniref:retention module-containing protein n=1 Tax=Pseudomonas sp. LA21 TaxID=2893373 RepID=UPI001FB79C6E|nr:retention module-containing protein [Pseudomonas sp. LA21]MCJ1888024.1 retention module-containing protein [Pseudomonas sp. LA21]